MRPTKLFAFCVWKEGIIVIDVLLGHSPSVFSKKSMLIRFCMLLRDGLIFPCNKCFQSTWECSRQYWATRRMDSPVKFSDNWILYTEQRTFTETYDGHADKNLWTIYGQYLEGLYSVPPRVIAMFSLQIMSITGFGYLIICKEHRWFILEEHRH